MQELKTCKKCNGYVWVEKGFQECDYCLGSNNQTRKYRKNQYDKNKRRQRILLSLGKSIDFIAIVLFIVFIFSGCIASSKGLIETRKDVNSLSKNVENLAKDHKNLVGVVSDGFQLPPETKKSLLDNANKIVGDSKELTKHTEKRLTENVNAFSFDAIMEGLYKIAEWSEPLISALNKVAGDSPYGSIIISVITLVSTLVGKGALDNIKEKKKLKKKVLVAKRANPKAIEEYEALEKQVDEEIKTGKLKL